MLTNIIVKCYRKRLYLHYTTQYTFHFHSALHSACFWAKCRPA